MKHFLYEEKEYKPRISFRRYRETRDSAQEMARLLRRFTGKNRSGGGGGGAADMRQNCVVKMQYSNSIEAHRVQVEKYLVREGTAEDLTDGAALFGTDTEEYKANMSAKNFRVFLSPQSKDVDLKKLTEKFVSRLELQTGYKLYWQGACHYNTAHPHAHLLINGVDKAGKEVSFPRDVVKTFMRENARDLCTKQVGFRLPGELLIERDKELSASRWTRLDERLRVLHGGKGVDLDGLGTDKPRFLARLEALRKLNLCRYEAGSYRLNSGWEENLKANGRYNTFLKVREELGAPNLRVYSGEAGRIAGRVMKVFRVDGDASDNHAVVVKSSEGKAWFIPLFKQPELRDGAARSALKEGELVSIQTYKSQKGRLTPLIYKAQERAMTEGGYER